MCKTLPPKKWVRWTGNKTTSDEDPLLEFLNVWNTPSLLCPGYDIKLHLVRLQFWSTPSLSLLPGRRCPWCNGYRRRKWTRRHEFKSWPRLIAFHIALMPLGKVWIQLFSLQLWVNSKVDWVLQLWWGN